MTVRISVHQLPHLCKGENNSLPVQLTECWQHTFRSSDEQGKVFIPMPFALTLGNEHLVPDSTWLVILDLACIYY